MYGTLTFICGPMFSGKTTELLKRILWAKNGQHTQIKVFKPAFDRRYAQLEIVSHEGLSVEAQAIYNWTTSIEYLIDQGVECVFFDEVQFFCAPNFENDVMAIIRDLLSAGINVVASGLDMDWQGAPFEISGQLAAMAEEMVKLKAICHVCGRPASRTYKKGGSQKQVEIGGTDLYQARCLLHWSRPDEKQASLFARFDSPRLIKLQH